MQQIMRNPYHNGDKSKLVRCKGTTRTTVKDNITLDFIVNTLKDSSLSKHDNYYIRKKYNSEIYKINKVSLLCYDDKRGILENGIASLSRGHPIIKTYNNLL